jgi:hypothetical protein
MSLMVYVPNEIWSVWKDSNPRHSAPKADAIDQAMRHTETGGVGWLFSNVTGTKAGVLITKLPPHWHARLELNQRPFGSSPNALSLSYPRIESFTILYEHLLKIWQMY